MSEVKARAPAHGALRLSVLVVDGDRLSRDGLAALLANEAGVHVVGTAADAEEAEQLGVKARPDVIVLDINVPGALELVGDLRRLLPDAAFVVLTQVAIGSRAVEALGAGAGAYLLRSCAIETLVAAIRAVRDGDIVISNAVADRLFTLLDAGWARPATGDGLTTREIEVIRLVAAGAAYKQAAAHMRISYKTIRNYVSHIYEKLSIYDRSQLVLYAVRKGLVDPGDARSRR